ncbi:ABC transporter permease [Halogeometricum sp. S1BR25-6]|uniref:ABC transporter permease n=1 Tax=Halogeometricum salsisoli TaxID=2950536 RepID=A0ABU2GIR2_9EURY|nr:ABC transporter permease [Halogeometricum sp. S1BR25-6]MDS0300148.1 ABC transporter permease [Halogeometricum sp. S1BR25-6]
MSPTDRPDDGADAPREENASDPLVDAVGGAYADSTEAERDARSAITGHDGTGRRIADGGRTVSEFEQMAEVSMTDAERRRQWFDERLLAPARIVWNDWRARVGLLVVAAYLFMGIVAPYIVTEPRPNQGPLLVGAFRTLTYPLGTTASGTSILSQVVHATPSMLVMITAGAVFTVVLGTAVGTVAGYKGGRTDSVLMTLSDIMLSIPGLPLTIVLATALQIQGNPVVIGVLLTINAWAGLARAIRSQVLTIRDDEYVEASRIMGMGTPTIVTGDIIPNLMPYITMNFVQQARAVIFGSVGLYFLGVLPYNSTNWGVMMNAAVNRAGATSSPTAFHWLLVPMVTVIILALGLTLLAQGADRVFNPRVRARHAKSVAGDGDGDRTETTKTGEI